MKTQLLLLSMIMILTLSACETTMQATNDEIDTEETEGSEAIALAEVSYIDYSDEKYESLLGKEPFAIFFHASWCPTCQLMDRDILSNSSDFPYGSVILKADYDTETELKKTYEITSQSTIVMVNADGSVAEILTAPSFSKMQNSFLNLLE